MRADIAGTPVEEVLPVTILPWDDRVEVPEGFRPEMRGPAAHPILDGLGTEWPLLLGYNEVALKEEAELLLKVPDDAGGHPLLATGAYGKGRAIAWTSDIGPHWCPPTFVSWEGYGRLWQQCLSWLTHTSGSKRGCRRRGPSANGGNPDGLGRNADTSVEGCER